MTERTSSPRIHRVLIDVKRCATGERERGKEERDTIGDCDSVNNVSPNSGSDPRRKAYFVALHLGFFFLWDCSLTRKPGGKVGDAAALPLPAN